MIYQLQLGNRYICIGHKIVFCKLRLGKAYVVTMANLLLSTSVTLWLIWNTKRKKFEILRMKDVGNTEGAQMRRQWIMRWQSRYWWTEWSSYQLNDLDSSARLPTHHDYHCRRFTRQTMQNTLNITYHTMYTRSTVEIAWLPRLLSLTFYQPLQHIQPNQMQTSLKQWPLGTHCMSTWKRTLLLEI